MTSYDLWLAKISLVRVFRTAWGLGQPSESDFDELFPEGLRANLGDFRMPVEMKLRNYVKTAEAGDSADREKAWDELRVCCKDVDAGLNECLRAIPNGKDKAIDMLRAGTALNGGVDTEWYPAVVWLSKHGYDMSPVVDQIRLDWLAERQHHSLHGDPATNVFWRARPEDEERYAFYHLEVARHFQISGFEDSEKEVLEYFGLWLVVEPEYHGEFLYLLAGENELWLPLIRQIRLGCARLVSIQSTDGYWSNPSIVDPTSDKRIGAKVKWLPDPLRTAIHTLVLARFAKEEFEDSISCQGRSKSPPPWQRFIHKGSLEFTSTNVGA